MVVEESNGDGNAEVFESGDGEKFDFMIDLTMAGEVSED